MQFNEWNIFIENGRWCPWWLTSNQNDFLASSQRGKNNMKKNENNGNSEMISVYHCFIRFPLLFVRRRKLLEIVANYSGIISFELIWKESAFSLMIELCSSIVCRRLHLNWKLAKFSSIMKIKFGIEVIWWSAQAGKVGNLLACPMWNHNFD